MKLCCLSLNYKNSSLDVREKFTFRPSGFEKIPGFLKANNKSVSEIAVLSTCNRVEIYLVAADDAEPEKIVTDFFTEILDLNPFDYLEPVCLMNTDLTVKHLFRVAAGLESMIIGENEIVNQIKRAYRRALDLNISGPYLNRLFEKSLRVAKKVRSETVISRFSGSISEEAVKTALQIHGSLENTNIVVIGAGEASELTCRRLARSGARAVVVSSRHFETASRLAEKFSAEAVGFEQLDKHLLGAEIIISQTAAPHLIVETPRLEGIMKKRGDEKLLVIDIAVPRDFSPRCGGLKGVRLLNIDDLKKRLTKEEKPADFRLSAALEIIDDELENYINFLTGRRFVPAIKKLNSLASRLHQKELERLTAGLELSTADREDISGQIGRKINSFFHPLRHKLSANNFDTLKIFEVKSGGS